ncbi:SRPBCC family protein [Prauserella cavernicola]|uniref:SRPBCC family protein n=1 Tax=Prauserella cavernicola TaxID=2800127 RepID=A0A934QQQ0_9PSEU|nr:SRPBCC family protein [Prauserella cavernicola]MBK1784986.1 SRPBCC family protein [Prauserella cavernicola]
MVGRRFSFEVRRSSSAAPEKLFRLETDGELWSSWAGPLVPQSSQARVPCGVGAVRRVGLWPVLLSEQTVVYEPDRRHVYVLTSAGLPVRDYRAEVLFTPTGSGGTELCWSASFTERLPGTGAVTAPALHAALRYLAARLVTAAERA